MTYLSFSSLWPLLLRLSTSSTLSPLPLHLVQDPLVLNSSIDMHVHLPLVIFTSLVFLASGTLSSLSICSPCLFLKLSPLSSVTYGLTSFLPLMISIHVLFISSVRVANVLFLCCTPNHLLTSLLINFFTSIHPSLIHLTLIPSIPYSSHSYSVHHLFTSLLINLFTSIHPSLISHSHLVTSSYVHLWDPVFLLVSHQHTLTSLLYSVL